jgi:hypothetical protein
MKQGWVLINWTGNRWVTNGPKVYEDLNEAKYEAKQAELPYTRTLHITWLDCLEEWPEPDFFQKLEKERLINEKE